LIIKYLWYAIPGVFKVLWNPHHAPVALGLMLASALDCKLYDRIYLGKFNNWLHLIIIFSPFIYFYYLGKHKRQIVVNKTITVNIPPKVVQPVQPLRPYRPQVNEKPRQNINPPEFYSRQAGEDVRNAKVIDYVEIDSKKGVI